MISSQLFKAIPLRVLERVTRFAGRLPYSAGRFA
jgi:hypothetical protein